ncbi:MAG: extracellular elastinolytic metalloproteinase, partial [Mycobacteriales bacterium]
MQIRHSRPVRRRTRLAVAAGTALGLAITAGPAAWATQPRPARAGHTAVDNATGKAGGSRGDRQFYDARTGDTPRARQALRDRAAAAAARPAAKDLRRSLGNQAVLDMDGVTGTPRQVARLDGFLTGPHRGTPVDIALRYVSQHLVAFGLSQADLATLHLRQDYTDIAGIHHLSFVQTVDGTEVFGNGLKAHVTRDGALISVQGSPVAGAAAPAVNSRAAVRTAAEAITRA